VRDPPEVPAMVAVDDPIRINPLGPGWLYHRSLIYH